MQKQDFSSSVVTQPYAKANEHRKEKGSQHQKTQYQQTHNKIALQNRNQTQGKPNGNAT